jgi:hypothetical protein
MQLLTFGWGGMLTLLLILMSFKILVRLLRFHRGSLLGVEISGFLIFFNLNMRTFQLSICLVGAITAVAF